MALASLFVIPVKRPTVALFTYTSLQGKVKAYFPDFNNKSVAQLKV